MLLKSGTRCRCPLTPPVQHHMRSPQCTQAREENKTFILGRNKMVSLHRWHDCPLGRSQGINKDALRTKEFSKASHSMVNMQKSSFMLSGEG